MGCGDGLAHGTQRGHPRQPDLPLAPGGMAVWGGSREEAAWAADRGVWAVALKNTETQGRWEETAAFFLDVLNADSRREQP